MPNNFSFANNFISEYSVWLIFFNTCNNRKHRINTSLQVLSKTKVSVLATIYRSTYLNVNWFCLRSSCICAKSLHRIKNWPVACTSADVAIKWIFNLLLGDLGILVQETVEQYKFIFSNGVCIVIIPCVLS